MISSSVKTWRLREFLGYVLRSLWADLEFVLVYYVVSREYPVMLNDFEAE